MASPLAPFWPPAGELLVLKPDLGPRLGYVRHALFDFDGTLSTLREGWEGVMTDYMLQSICGRQPPSPEIKQEVRQYIDRSTGTMTIHQMKWLAEAVRRIGLVPKRQTAQEYKSGYVQRMQAWIRARKTALAQGELTPEAMMIAGSRDFLTGLAQQGVTLYLASGTDHRYVVEEAHALGLTDFFGARIYGAQESSEADQKELVIKRIITENRLAGSELLVVGDGPVEIREALKYEAVALGVASDEVKRAGWNQRKVRRLTEAGADLVVPDFTHWRNLLEFLT